MLGNMTRVTSSVRDGTSPALSRARPVIACDWPQTLCARNILDRHCYSDLICAITSTDFHKYRSASRRAQTHLTADMAAPNKQGKMVSCAQKPMAMPYVDGHS
jgi:hypothetical protein